MNRNQVLPQIELSADPSALRRVDLCAHQAYTGHGFLSITDMPRLLEETSAVGDNDGFHWKLETNFEKSPGAEPRQIMNLELKGQIHLVCQRCLRNCPIELAEKRRYVMLGSEDKADAFSVENDEEEPLVASQHFNILETMEDEILLSLPLIPKHPDGACKAHASSFSAGADESDALEKPENPFNILKNMKKNS